jgi:putative NADPH-quinone reductase
MNITIILANPNKNSFCHAIACACTDRLKNDKHHIHFHDLYKEKFPALLPYKEIPRTAKLPSIIKKHCEEIKRADGIIIIHPNWWGQPPAILKGWIDRVIRPGEAYEFMEGDEGDGIPRGLLNAEFALVFNTSNTPAKREREVFKDPLETLWKNCIFNLCGIARVKRKMFNVVVTSTDAERRKWLKTVEKMVGEEVNRR